MQTFDLTIEKIVHGGLGLGQVEGKRVLVPLVAPGERVRVIPTEEHRRYMKARLLKILEPHPKRREAPCPYFGACGGCDFQHLPHEEQLAIKKGMVVDAFRRIGKLDVEGIVEEPGSVCPEFRYRNRIRLSYAPGELVGLVRRGSNQVIGIDACLLMPEAWNKAALPWLKTLPAADKASFRIDTDGRMIASLMGHTGARNRVMKRMSALGKGEAPFPGALGVLFNAKPIKGTAEFEVNLAGHRFRVHATSFFQVNYAGAEKLVEVVGRIAGESSGGTLIDLHAGVGTLSIALAGEFERVVGVEIARSAVRDFKNNIELNEVSNVDLVEGPAEEMLPGIIAGLPPGAPVTVLADPPRTGIADKAVPLLTDLRPQRIIYVSCDPATLARDVARLGENGYTLRSLEIVDLFPQTAHVECVAALEQELSKDSP
ncbi:MAG: class I SAM-dependent RNA methyltransferase [Candidatus Eisenbacteria sp.]|nr:class I SAM-dependent RNA methyltransferase [Candidatus Eisenbacteria bacterium]